MPRRRKAIARRCARSCGLGFVLERSGQRRAQGQRPGGTLQSKVLATRNETSYGNACFKKDEAIATTIEFAKAMRERDRSLKLIGWGDNGWASDLVSRADEHMITLPST